MPSNDTIKKVLISALKKVENGWTKGPSGRKMINGKIHYTADAAIVASSKDLELIDDAMLWLCFAMAPDYQNPYNKAIDDVISFNDKQDDKRKIVNVFKKAIASLPLANFR